MNSVVICHNFSHFTFHDSRTLIMTGNRVVRRIGMIDGRKRDEGRKSRSHDTTYVV